jgi:predicted PurR-regulated permease PerM
MAWIRGMKILDIIFIGTLQFLSGFFVAVGINRVLAKIDKEDENKKSTSTLLLHIISLIVLFIVLYYIIRNIIQWIPSPFHGIGGYDHTKVRELYTAPLLVYALIYYQTDLQEKLKELNDRIAK